MNIPLKTLLQVRDALVSVKRADEGKQILPAKEWVDVVKAIAVLNAHIDPITESEQAEVTQ